MLLWLGGNSPLPGEENKGSGHIVVKLQGQEAKEEEEAHLCLELRERRKHPLTRSTAVVNLKSLAIQPVNQEDREIVPLYVCVQLNEPEEHLVVKLKNPIVLQPTHEILDLYRTDNLKFQTTVVPDLRELVSDPSHKDRVQAVVLLALSHEQKDIELAHSIAYGRPSEPRVDFNRYIDAALEILICGDEESKTKACAFILNFRSAFHYVTINYVTDVLLKSTLENVRQGGLALLKGIITDQNSDWSDVAARYYLVFEGTKPSSDFLIDLAHNKQQKKFRKLAFAVICYGNKDEATAVADVIKEIAENKNDPEHVFALTRLYRGADEEYKAYAQGIIEASFNEPGNIYAKNYAIQILSFWKKGDLEFKRKCYEFLKNDVRQRKPADYDAVSELHLDYHKSILDEDIDEVVEAVVQNISDLEDIIEPQYNKRHPSNGEYSRLSQLWHFGYFYNSSNISLIQDAAFDVLRKIATNASGKQRIEDQIEAKEILRGLEEDKKRHQKMVEEREERMRSWEAARKPENAHLVVKLKEPEIQAPTPIHLRVELKNPDGQ